MLGQEPRQTTSIIGHLNKPSIQANPNSTPYTPNPKLQPAHYTLNPEPQPLSPHTLNTTAYTLHPAP